MNLFEKKQYTCIKTVSQYDAVTLQTTGTG